MANAGDRSPKRVLLGSQSRTAAPFHTLSKLAHGFRCDRASLATRQRSFGFINSDKHLHPSTLTLLPHRKRFRQRVFSPAKAAALNSSAYKSFLVRRELYF